MPACNYDSVDPLSFEPTSCLLSKTRGPSMPFDSAVEALELRHAAVDNGSGISSGSLSTTEEIGK